MLSCIYISKNSEKNVQQVIDHLKDRNIFFTIDDAYLPQIDFSKYAIVNFYNIMKEFDNELIFIGKEDYNLRAENVKQIRKKLFIEKENLPKITLIENTEVFILDKTSKIRKAKNAELQSIFRQ